MGITPKTAIVSLALVVWCGVDAEAGPVYPLTALVKVRDFDIDGVRLFMSASDALKAVRSKNPKSTCSVAYSTSQIDANKSYVDSMSCSLGDYELNVLFYDAIPKIEYLDEPVPSKKGREQAWRIDLHYAGTTQLSFKFQDEFRREVVAKYGNPSSPDDYWCTIRDPGEDKPQPGLAGPCSWLFPYMHIDVRDAALTIEDASMERRVSAYVESLRKPPSDPNVPHL